MAKAPTFQAARSGELQVAWHRRFSVRLALAVAILTMVVVNIAVFVMSQTAREELNSTLHEEGEAIGSLIGASVRAAMFMEEFEMAQSHLEETCPHVHGLLSVRVLDASGGIVASWPKEAKTFSEATSHLVAVSISSGTEGESMGRVETVMDRAILDDVLDAVEESSRVVTLFLVFLGAISGLGLATRAAKPARELAGALVSVAQEGRFDTRLVSRRNDEIGAAVLGFNQLMEHMQETVHGLSRSVDTMASGDFTARSNYSLKGDLGRLMDKVEDSRGRLRQVVESIVDSTSLLASGVLTSQMEGLEEGEFARIQLSMNQAVDSLRDVLSQASVVAEQVKAASDGITRASHMLVGNAQEQETLVANADQVVGVVRDAISNLVMQSVAEAQEGEQSMQDMVSSMEEIAESSNAIARVNSVIDEIAFQTNLLALNAAVEAARAGRHGRGFAVVAQEVRTLAQRCSEAAQETGTLIRAGGGKVERGVQIAQKCSKVLEGMVSHVTEIEKLTAVTDVAGRAGLAAIKTELEKIHRGTLVVRGASNELAQASEQTDAMVASLQGQLKGFQVDQTPRQFLP